MPRPPFFVSKDAGRNDLQGEYYCDAGEWIFASGYFHKTSFAAGQARLGRQSNHIIMDF